MTGTSDMARRRLSSALRLAALALGAGLLTGCAQTLMAVAPSASPASGSVAGSSIGQGQTKIALLAPLSGASGGMGFRNAAELAWKDLGNPDLQILIKDTGGVAQGGQAAAQAAINEGAKMIIGPLFAQEVMAAAAVAKAANVPIIAFSTDPNVASRGVYLLSFLAESSVDRVVSHAVQSGKRSFAALTPSNSYGALVEAAFMQSAARYGGRVVGVERLSGDAAADKAAAGRIAQLATGGTQVDALFIPEGGPGLRAALDNLQAAGLNAARVKMLGTGVWDDPQTLADPRLQGGWFAGPAPEGYELFAARYRQSYGLTPPLRTVTLAYDATRLASQLVKSGAPIDEQTMLTPNGFSGLDGIFRFRADGANDRGLAVLEVRGGGAAVISPAPASFLSASQPAPQMREAQQ